MLANGKPSSMLSCATECHLRMPSPLSGLFGTSVASQRKNSSESPLGGNGILTAASPLGEETWAFFWRLHFLNVLADSLWEKEV